MNRLGGKTIGEVNQKKKLEGSKTPNGSSSVSETNSSRQAVIKEYTAYHNTNPAGPENQLSAQICRYDPFSVYDTRVDFCK